MISLRHVALVAFFGLAAASPTVEMIPRFTPGTVNNTREFYLKMEVFAGSIHKYNGWRVIPYHTGAGLADPVFVPPTGNESGSPARLYLNGTNLSFDVGYILGMNANIADTNYARWEPVSAAAGYGVGPWYINSTTGAFAIDNSEHDGWLVCEWFHGINAPQLFQMIKGFDGTEAQARQVPSSCGRVNLFPVYI